MRMRQSRQFIGPPRRYLWSLVRDLGAQTGLMLLAVEALYLSDKVITHLIFDTVRNQLGIAFLAETLVLAVPEILGTGFPLAVLIAVYVTLLRRRDAGEFMILSGAGLGPGALVLTLAALGLAVVVLWGPFRAFVEPLAARQLSIRLVEGRYEAIKRGSLSEGQFLQLSAATFYQQRAPEGAAAGSGAVFVYLTPAPGNELVATAKALRVDYTPGAPSATMDLTDAQILGLLRGAGQTRRQSHHLEVDRLQLSDVALETVDTAALLVRPRSTTMPALTARWRTGDLAAGQAAMQRWLGIGLAALTPLMAGLALAMTRGRLRLLALPGGLGAVLGAGLAIPPLASAMLGLGPVLAPAMAGTGLVAIAAAIAAAVNRQVPGALLPQRLL